MKACILLVVLFLSYNFSYANEIFFRSIERKNYNECIYWNKQFSKKEQQQLKSYDKIVKKFKVLGISYMFGIDISLDPRSHKLCLAMSEDNLHNAIEELKKFIVQTYEDEIGFIGTSSIERALKLNDSKEYQTEIERIVKKYCDQCDME